MKILKSIKDRFGFRTGPTGPAAPTYAVTPTSTSITEGDTVTFNVTTTNVPSGTTLYWTNAGTTDGTDFNIGVNSGSFTITNNTGNVALITFNNATYEGTETIVFQVRTGSTSGPIVATAATVNIADAAPTYSVSPTTTSITEGSSVTFNVTTTNVPNSTTLYWTNSGTTDGTDFSGGANSGSFTITSNAGSVSITTLNNAAYEGTETIIFNVRTGSTSGPIVATASTVNVADAAPTYSVSPTTTSITEGSSVTFNVTTTNVPNSTTLYWTNGGTTDGTDFSGGANNGSFTITSNAGSVSITTLNNAAVEGTETIIFQVRTGSTSGPIVATATTVNVADAAPTYSVSPSTTSVSEPNSVTWTITTTNIANGTTLYWTNSGTTNLSDFTAAVNSGSFTINSNTGSVSLTLGQLDTLEGTETIIFEVRTGSTSGPIVATSATVSVSDATNSFAISPSVSSVNEGGTVTWTVTAYNSPTTLYWTNGGTTTGADFTDGQNSGSFSISGTSGSISRTLTNDATTEGSETIIMQVRTGSTSGPIVVTSSTVTVNDTSVPTASVSPNVSSVNEGSSVTWTVSTSGYANGTYYWTNGGTTNASDFSIAANSGSFTLTSGSGSISLTLNNDLSSGEGSETIIMQIRTGSTGGPIIATSSTVTVNDTSFTPPPQTISWTLTGGGADTCAQGTPPAGGGGAGFMITGSTTLSWLQGFTVAGSARRPALTPFTTTHQGVNANAPNGTAGGGGQGSWPQTTFIGPYHTGGGGCRAPNTVSIAQQHIYPAGLISTCPAALPGGRGAMVWCGSRTPQNAANISNICRRSSAGGGGGNWNPGWGERDAYASTAVPMNPDGARTHGGPGTWQGNPQGGRFWLSESASSGGIGGEVGGGQANKAYNYNSYSSQAGTVGFCGNLGGTGNDAIGFQAASGYGFSPVPTATRSRGVGGHAHVDFTAPKYVKATVCSVPGTPQSPSPTSAVFSSDNYAYSVWTCGNTGATFCLPTGTPAASIVP